MFLFLKIYSIFRTDVISSAPPNFMQCIPNKKKLENEPDMSFESPVLDFRFVTASQFIGSLHLWFTWPLRVLKGGKGKLSLQVLVVLDFTLPPRFPEDKRVEEISHMFATSKPVKIVVNRRPEMSDAEFADQEVRPSHLSKSLTSTTQIIFL